MWEQQPQMMGGFDDFDIDMPSMTPGLYPAMMDFNLEQPYDQQFDLAASQTNSTRRVKREMANEQDRLLISRDDSELTKEELALKRKAQNRQAQRAFRERKESKLKDLEAKLAQLEEERQRLMDQLECMRAQNKLITSEFHSLKASLGHSPSSQLPGSQYNMPAPETHHVTKFEFPLSQEDFISGLVSGTTHQVHHDHLRDVYDEPGLEEKLMAIGAVWDYLLERLEERGIELESEDITLIMGRLRGHEKCSGFGPAYPMLLVESVYNEQTMNM